MLATLTILLEVPQRLHQLPFALLAKRTESNAGEVVILVVVPNQLRLVVIRIHMTRSTCHENEDHPLGPGCNHRLTLKQCRRTGRGRRLLAQPSQGQRTESTGRSPEHFPARNRLHGGSVIHFCRSSIQVSKVHTAKKRVSQRRPGPGLLAGFRFPDKFYHDICLNGTGFAAKRKSISQTHSLSISHPVARDAFPCSLGLPIYKRAVHQVQRLSRQCSFRASAGHNVRVGNVKRLQSLQQRVAE